MNSQLKLEFEMAAVMPHRNRKIIGLRMFDVEQGQTISEIRTCSLSYVEDNKKS